MLRKICCGLLCAITLFSTNTFCLENNLIRTMVSGEYEFQPNQSQIFVNYLFWSVEINCQIVNQGENVEFQVVALAKKGKVNERPLSAGESYPFTVSPGENLKINADAGAKFEIINLSPLTVKVNCTL